MFISKEERKDLEWATVVAEYGIKHDSTIRITKEDIAKKFNISVENLIIEE